MKEKWWFVMALNENNSIVESLHFSAPTKENLEIVGRALAKANGVPWFIVWSGTVPPIPFERTLFRLHI